MVQRLIDSMVLSDPDSATISFVPKTNTWNTTFIRHKKRNTYILGGKYMITVSSIRESVQNWVKALDSTGTDERIDITPSLYKKPHMEVEVGV